MGCAKIAGTNINGKRMPKNGEHELSVATDRIVLAKAPFEMWFEFTKGEDSPLLVLAG